MLSDAPPPEVLSSAVGEFPFGILGLQTWWDLGSFQNKNGCGLDSQLPALTAVRISSTQFLPCIKPSPLLQLPSPSRDGLPGWPGFQLFGRLALCCDCNGRKMKNDLKAPAEIKSQIALFIKGKGNEGLVWKKKAEK